MSNRRPQQIGLPSFAAKVDIASGNEGAGLNISNAGSSYETAARLFSEAAARSNAYADEQAQLDGTRQGKIAAGQEGYKPTEADLADTSLYGRSKAQAATTLYAQNVQAKLGTDIQKLATDHADDPVKFQQGMVALKGLYEKEHIIPEMKAPFDTHFTNSLNSYMPSINKAKEAKDNDSAKAGFSVAQGENSANRARLLMVNPQDEATINQVQSITDTNIGAIRALQDKGAIDAYQAEQLIKQEYVKARTDIINAQTARMGVDDLAKYQENFRQQFKEGKLKGIDGDAFNGFDASLTKTMQVKNTEGRRQENELRTRAEDLIQRQREGLPPPEAEWNKLDEDARRLGSGGLEVLNNAKKRSEMLRVLSNAKPEEAEKIIAGYENSARSTNVIDKIIGVESGGKADAKNPKSSAEGAGQFIDSTWLLMIKKYRPDVASGKNEEQILDLKYNYDLSREMTTRYAQENERGLRSAGIEPTAGNVYLAHFAGLGGAQKLHANPSGDAALVMAGGDSGKAAGIRAANRFLAGKSAQEVIDWAARKMGGAAGIAKPHAEDVQFMRTVQAEQNKLFSTDILAAAKQRNIISSITPLDVTSAPIALAVQISDRINQSDAVSKHFERDIQILRPDEKGSIKGLFEKEGSKALPALAAMLQGAGKQSKLLVKELMGDAPEVSQAAALMLGGASKSAVNDVLEFARVKDVEGVKLAKPPAERMPLIKEEIGRALDHHPEDKARIIAAADALYSVRAFRRNIQAKDSDAKNLYKDALQDAAGMNKIDGGKAGGFTLFGSHPVFVPQGVVSDKFKSIMSAITSQDLSALPIPPMAASGFAYPLSKIQEATPVKFGAGYRLIVGDPKAETPLYIRGKDGNPFVLPFEEMRHIFEKRVPTAFVNGNAAFRAKQEEMIKAANMNSPL